MKSIAVNRKARHDYFIHEKFEAGIVLLGSEVKALREGRVNLNDSFVRLMRGEAFLVNCHIPLYSKIQGYVELDPTRMRKLLMKRAELDQLAGLANRKGYTIVPLSIYFSRRNFAKVEIAVAQGKKQYDKRETIKRRIHEKETAKAIKYHSRGHR